MKKLVPKFQEIWCLLNGGHHKEWKGGIKGYIYCIKCPYRTRGFEHSYSKLAKGN